MRYRDGHIAEAGRELDRFVVGTNWGFIRPEFLKYMRLELGIERPEISMHYFQKYRQTPSWFDLMHTLLQKSDKSFLVESGRLYRKSKKALRSAHITNGTVILAKTRTLAYARLFVEIEEDFNELRQRKIVSDYCGYAILRELYALKIPRSRTDELAKKKLLSSGLLIEKNNEYILPPHIKDAFELAEKIKPEVLKWPYRINWILPLKK